MPETQARESKERYTRRTTWDLGAVAIQHLVPTPESHKAASPGGMQALMDEELPLWPFQC